MTWKIPAAIYLVTIGFKGVASNLDSVRRCLMLYEQETNDTLRLEYLKRAGTYYVNSNPDSGLAIIRRALALAREIKLQDQVTSCYINLSYFFRFKNNDSSLYWSTRAYENAQLQADTFRMIVSLLNQGNANRSLTRYGEAFNDFNQALVLANNLDTPLSYGKEYWMAVSNEGFGAIYFDQEDYENALTHFHRAYRYYRQYLMNMKGKPGSETSALETRIGASYFRMERYDSALFHLENALTRLTSEQDTLHLTDTYYLLGATYLVQGRTAEAIELMKKSVSNAAYFAVPVKIATAYQHLGEAYLADRQYFAAREAFSKSLQVSAASSDLLPTDRNSYLGLAQSQYHTGDLQNAFLNLQRAYTLNDSVLDQQQSDAVMRLQTQFETETHKQRSEQLAAEKRQSDQQRNLAIAGGLVVSLLTGIIFFQFSRRRQISHTLVTNQLRNKVLRSQLNPHFIFNALNSIRSFISEHPELADSYLSRFSVLMRQVLENSEEEKITLEEEIAMLENYMHLESIRLPFGFDHAFVFNKILETNNIMIPPLIIQPVIENAIWHGLKPLPRRGKIEITFEEGQDFLYVTVKDDGAGAGKTTETNGAPVKKRSFGIQITRERIKLLNRKARSTGEVTQHIHEHGAEVKISIPV